MPKLIALLALSLFSCVTAKDLQRLQVAQVQFEGEISGIMADADKTATEKLQAFKDANDERMSKTGEVINDIKDRTEAVLASGKNLTGNVLLDTILGSVLAGGAAFVGANKSRDNRRRLRGEATVLPGGIAPPPPPSG